jgi:hypothetical protein
MLQPVYYLGRPMIMLTGEEIELIAAGSMGLDFKKWCTVSDG